eukprot:gene6132-12417_t
MFFSAQQRTALDKCFCCCVKESLRPGEIIGDDGRYFAHPVRIGRNILFYGRRNTQWPMQCHMGPDWPGVVLVYTGIIVSNIVILGIISPLGWPVILIGGSSAIALLYTYSVVALSDPGIVYKECVASPEDGNLEENLSSHLVQNNISESKSINNSSTSNESKVQKIECGTCEIQRPITAAHCSYCGVCIDNLDHHCPWCGKCIGKKTKGMFFIFLVKVPDMRGNSTKILSKSVKLFAFLELTFLDSKILILTGKTSTL